MNKITITDEKIKITTIDRFMEDNKINHVDLLKIDTEGAEYLILPSVGFFKMANKINYIIGEGHHLPNKITPEFLPLILKDAGFKTEFLPIKNYFLTMDFDDGVSKRHYEIEKNTIFFAKHL